MKRSMVFFVFVFAGGLVFAQSQTPQVDRREAAQRGRIYQGRANGELTNREAAALNAQQRHIKRTERRAKADGTVTASERRKLRREQNRANRNIRRQKHDAQLKPN